MITNKRFISDEEFERLIDEKAEALRRAQWEEINKDRPPKITKFTPEELESYRQRIFYTPTKKKPLQVTVLNGCNDKWEHGDMFYEQFKQDLIEEAE